MFCADLHMHSRFARATSRNLTLPVLEQTARQKGITVVGTGDFTHPQWFSELSTQFELAEPGLFILKGTPKSPVRFMLTVEIASIFNQGGKNRRIHTLVMLPSLEAANRFNQSMVKRGANLGSDGRPIVGLSVKDITQLALEADQTAIIIPAHIWTPWFGLLGSMSGFDSIEECFEELTPHIFAVETGLSSDPPMNWRLSMLDDVALVSFSDAHSPSRMAREATQFDGELSYEGICEALWTGAPNRAEERKDAGTKLLGTVEFFPEEGKYHYDGHREHQVRWSPAETAQHNGICEVCGRKVTVGVLSRVQSLADRNEDTKPNGAPDFMSLVPLEEIIAEVLGVRPGAKRVSALYDDLIRAFDNELAILTKVPISDIAAVNQQLSEAIERVRQGNLHIEPGYDGEFGTVHVFNEPVSRTTQQGSLFN